MLKCVKINIDKKHTKEYLRNLGLACVLGSLTAFFLSPHDSYHQTISIAILFLIGFISSLLGIIRGENNG
jgi:hypothetical protein